MYKYLFAIIFFSVFLTGCVFNTQSKLNEKTQEKLGLTEQAQDAVFHIQTGWVGGGGSYPIMSAESGPIQYNNSSVYLDGVQAEKILDENNMPSCWVGTPLIKISANITLEPKEDINYSIPPDENGKQPLVHYYSAKINKLYDILIKAEKCKD